MVALNYKKGIHSDVRMPAPRAAMFVAERLFGAAWVGNPAAKRMPILKDHGKYLTRELSVSAGKYQLTSRPVVVRKELEPQFREAHRLFREAKALIIRAVYEGKLTGIVQPASRVAFELDETWSGLLQEQHRTIFTTGFVRLKKEGSHGRVVFEKEKLERLLAKASSSPSSKLGVLAASEYECLRDLAKGFATEIGSRYGPGQADRPIVTADALVELKPEFLKLCRRNAAGISDRKFRDAVVGAFRAEGLMQRAQGGAPRKGQSSKGNKLLEDFFKKQPSLIASKPLQKT